MTAVLTNIHPADELHAVREEMAQLEAREKELRDILLAGEISLHGDSYTARIADNKRETLDRKAITEAFGEEAVAPYLRTTHYKVVKLVEN